MFTKRPMTKPARNAAESARRAAVLRRLEQAATWNRTPPATFERSPLYFGGRFVRAWV
jgi:hypothetical protein